MTADVVALVVALALPILALAIVFGLIEADDRAFIDGTRVGCPLRGVDVAISTRP